MGSRRDTDGTVTHFMEKPTLRLIPTLTLALAALAAAVASAAAQMVPSVTVPASFAVAQNIVLESALSFLGLGAEARTPSWGGMLADSRAYLATAWWPTAMPGVAIMLTVLSINPVGDWLRDTLEPPLRA